MAIIGTGATVGVPGADSANNILERDVVGNKNDDEAGTSLYSGKFISLAHIHSVQLCKPTLGNGLAVISNGTWVLGSYAVVFAVGEVSDAFDIHMVHISSFTFDATYELILYAGADGAEYEICHTRFTRLGTNTAGSILPCITPQLPAGTQVKAKVACSIPAPSTVTFAVLYHKY